MNVLVIGKHSYIANRFTEELERDGLQYEVHSVRDDSWRDIDFSKFSVVVYFAAIVHHPEITDKELYYNVNAKIPYEMAQKCSQAGVGQFIYTSTCAVWGIGPCFGQDNSIDEITPVNPHGLYGMSKKRGEDLLLSLNDAAFNVAIMRLPNVYGENCPGRFYHRLELLSKFPVLPTLNTKHIFSLISVDNVAKAILKVIADKRSGIMSPQDSNMMSIVDRISNIAKDKGHAQYQTKIFSPLIRFVYKIYPNKYFNNLYGGYYIDPESYETLTD